MPRGRRMLLVALFVATLLPRPARAETKSADVAHAQQLMQQAADDYARADYDGALRHYGAAYVIVSSPKLLFNLAQCHLALGHDVEAAQHFARFLAETSEAEASIAGFRAQAREKVAALEPKVGRLQLAAEPAGARLVLDGREVPPGLVYVTPAPATHDVVATAAGLAGAARTLSVDAGQVLDVRLTLAPERKPEPTAAAPALKPAVVAPAPPAPHRLPAKIALGAAGALAAGALTMGIVTHGQYQVLPPNPTGVTTDAERAVLRNARITDGLWAAAVVAAGAGAYLWFTAAPAPGSGGEVGVGGSF